MVKLQVFDIVFDHPQDVFHSGETLDGKVVMELSEPMKMRNLRITVSGKGHTHWSRTTGTGKNRHTSHYRSEEVYFDPTFILFGNDDGEAEHHPAGSFTYPFTLHLDPNLPSSFEGEYGHVRYYAKAVIDKPWKFDHEVKVPFTVINNLDLNMEPDTIRTPMQAEDQSTVNCCCYKSGTVHALFRVNRQGFVPGEAIQLYCKVDNHSNTDVINTRVALKQYMEYYGVCDGFFSSTEPKAKTLSEIVAYIDREGVPAGGTQVWDNVPLTIPPLPPSRLIGCQCINIAYAIKFYVSVNCGNDLKLACELTIGAVPLHPTLLLQGEAGATGGGSATAITLQPTPTHRTHSPGRAGMAAGGGYSPSSEAPPRSPRVKRLPKLPPPPTYQQCVKGVVNIADSSDTEYTRGRLNYAPCYPFYSGGSASLLAPPSNDMTSSRHSLSPSHNDLTSSRHSLTPSHRSNPSRSPSPSRRGVPPPAAMSPSIVSQPASISGVHCQDVDVSCEETV